ncbi:MAG: RagB/SusD family nutrient uptake outer membrane protein [Bacteroidota bacterium]
MKELKFFLVAAALAVFLPACTDFIERPTPQQSLPSSAAFNTASDLETALIGAYQAMQQSDFGATGLALNANILSDNGFWQGSFPSYVDMFNRALTPDNGEVTGLWRFGYLAINHANLVLRALDTSEDPTLTPEVRDRLRGEALFIRGLSYFELTRFYGLPYGSSSSSDPGVPILTTATQESGDNTFPTRNTVQEGYDQAINYLTEAANLLEPTGNPGRANATAATAYLAEIAFQQRDYAKAASLAEDVINAGYMLTASPSDPFLTEGSSEEIFAIISTVQDNPGVNGSLATFHHVNGRGGDVIFSSDLYQNGFLAVIPESDQDAATAQGDSIIDLRHDAFISFNENGDVNIEKYEDFANNADDLILVRLATFYLMRAEALARTDGLNQESVDLLNTIRARSLRLLNDMDEVVEAGDLATYELSDFADADELIEAIILERRVELAFEPNRVHDLKRLMRDIRDLPFDSPMLVFPIPQRDLDANTMLVQNPGY